MERIRNFTGIWRDNIIFKLFEVQEEIRIILTNILAFIQFTLYIWTNSIMVISKMKYVYISLALLLVSGILYAVTEIQYFTARNEQESIVLEWKTGIEDNLNHFEIERSASNPNNFVHIGSLNAIGSNSFYTYRDDL